MKTERMRNRLTAGALVLLGLLVLGGCGLKDDLYIPTDEESAAEQDTDEESQSEPAVDLVQ